MAQEEGSSTIEWGRSTGVVAKGNPSAREIQMPVYEGQLAYFVADI
jgi:hypothetical protein